MRRTIGGNAQDRRRARRAASRRANNGLSDADVRDIQSMIAAASGSTSLPLSERGVAWDSAAADKRVRDWAGVTDAPNAKYGQAFFLKDGDGSNFGDFHLPFADVIDGKLTAVWRGVTAAAAALQGSRGANVEGGDSAKPKIETYYASARKKYGDDSIQVPWAEGNESSTRVVGGLPGRGGNNPDSARESAARSGRPTANGDDRVDVLPGGDRGELRQGGTGDDSGLVRSRDDNRDSASEAELATGVSADADGADGSGTAATDSAVSRREAAASTARADDAGTAESGGSGQFAGRSDGAGEDLVGDESAEQEGAALVVHRLALAEALDEEDYEIRYAYWLTEFALADGLLTEAEAISLLIPEEMGGKPSKGTKKDKRLKGNQPGGDSDTNDQEGSDDQAEDDNMSLDPELAALAVIEDFAASVKCGCGHAFSEHSGAGGTCQHADGRGTCRCGEFAYPDADVQALADAIVSARPDLAGFEAEVGKVARRALLALQAAAGDVVWGPEEGFMDLLNDVSQALHPNEDDWMSGPWACDASVNLDKVLLCDGGDYYVAPITIDQTGEPIVADKADWVSVEPAGYVETGEGAMRLQVKLTDITLTAAGVADTIPEAVEVIPEASDEISPPTANANGEIPWTATFVPEGVLTEDGRAFAPGSIILPPDEQARQLPLTLMGLIETSAEGGHDRAKVAGRIDQMWRDEESGKVKASGVFSNEEWGQMIARMVESKELTGLSVDIAPLEYEHVARSDFFDESGKWTAVQGEDGQWSPAEGESSPEPESLEEWLNADLVLAITKAVIGMATVCPFPAFGQAEISLAASGMPRTFIGPLDLQFDCGCTPVEIVYGDEEQKKEGEALTAAAAGLAPVAPPSEWFEDPQFTEPTAMTITDDGRIFGHAWQWNTCHLSFDQCVTAPKSETNYAYYMLGEIACEDGERLTVGKITMDTGHAGTRLSRAAATAHYDNTGTVAAHVQFGEDEFGGWFAGAISPELSEEKVRLLRGATVSGDWRGVDGNLELVGLLACNIPGFPVPRSLQASVSVVDDEPIIQALVAAGIVTVGLEADIAALVSEVVAEA